MQLALCSIILMLASFRGMPRIDVTEPAISKAFNRSSLI